MRIADVVDHLVPGGVLRSITLDRGGRWNNFEHVVKAHRARIIGGMTLFEVVVRKRVKTICECHGGVKTEG